MWDNILKLVMVIIITGLTIQVIHYNHLLKTYDGKVEKVN